ncbi:MAG: MBOAT family O-acyltransferase [Lachnospira sp.]
MPICLADLLIFFVVGIWHGAAWKYIAYGMYNGIIIAVSSLLEPLYAKGFEKDKDSQRIEGMDGGSDYKNLYPCQYRLVF